MDDPTKYLTSTFKSYRAMLKASRIPPSVIANTSEQMEENIAGILVSSVLFFIARGLIGGSSNLLETSAVNIGLMVGAMAAIMLVQTVVLVLCRDLNEGDKAVDQWGTYLVFIWTFSLLAFIVDNLLVTLTWTAGISTYVGRAIGANDSLSAWLLSGIYSAIAIGILIIKTMRQHKDFRPLGIITAAVAGLCVNSSLIYLFVFRMRGVG